MRKIRVLTAPHQPIVEAFQFLEEAEVDSQVFLEHGLQPNGRKHMWVDDPMEVTTAVVEIQQVIGRVLKRMEDDESATATIILFDLINQFGLSVMIYLDKFELTGTELIALYRGEYNRKADFFRPSLIASVLKDKLQKLRNNT